MYMKRFDLNAKTHNEAINYIKNRILQIAHTRVQVKDIFEIPEGVWIKVEYNNSFYYSLYLLEQYRTHNRYYELWKQKSDEIGHEIKIIITSACSMSQYLKYKQIPYIVVNGLTNTPEYNIIENIYSEKYSKRTGVNYMNHIDEGLIILNKLSASLDAKLGYIIHPIFQSDEELKRCYNHTSLTNISPQSLINALEFRNIINNYSKFRTIKDFDEIKLSPLKDVNFMVAADIIQKRKDFEQYHIHTHEHSQQLIIYFNNWLKRLNIGEHFYQTIKEELMTFNNELIHK